MWYYCLDITTDCLIVCERTIIEPELTNDAYAEIDFKCKLHLSFYGVFLYKPPFQASSNKSNRLVQPVFFFSYVFSINLI